MQIGVIGSGRIGGTLAKHFVSAGHEVAVAHEHGPDSLAGLVQDLGANGHAATVPQAARFGELVVLAIPFGRYRELPAGELSGRIVVDATNYFPERDGHLAELDEGRTTSTELIAAHLAGARMVKAFNTMAAGHLRDYAHAGGANMLYGIPVSGDDDGAKRAVMDLIEEIGFEPADAGGLAEGGRKQQPDSRVFLADLPADELHATVGG
jgi:predicted dinucleotide-binding enzyme